MPALRLDDGRAVTVSAVDAAGNGTSGSIVIGSTTEFVTLVPGRLLDTRPETATVDGLFAGQGLRARRSLVVLSTAGRAGIPSDATASAINITVTGATSDGYVTAWPCGGSRPETSDLNFAAGATVAHGAIVKIGDSGAICVFTSEAAHLIVDVTGYQPASALYRALMPARLLDTRPGTTTIDGQARGEGAVASESSLRLVVAGRGGVPHDAEAVVVNLTVTGAEGDGYLTVTGAEGDGYLTVYSCGHSRPNASNINFRAGVTTANTVTAQLGDHGTLCIYSSATTHVIADINGYHPSGSIFNPMSPSRFADTRPRAQTIDSQAAGGGSIPAGTVVELTIAGRAGIPVRARAAVLNVTVTGPAAAGYLVVWPCGSARPEASTLNFAAGETVANTVLTGLDTRGIVCILTTAEVQVIVDVNGWY